MAYLLNHLLSRSAATYPERDAVRMGGVALSYAELDRQTNQAARALQALGVRRGDRVGIYVHKSFASIVSIFAILKAGAAYVPLDPNAPAQRLAYITRDCDVKVVLTASQKLKSLAELLEHGSPIQSVVLMDEAVPAESPLPSGVRVVSWASVSGEDSGEVACELIESDLAYILYTSGSTGSPKGVMISHRTILTFVEWCGDVFGLTPEDRVTSHAPLHFDLSTFDIYATLQAGAAIVLVGERLSSLPVKLVELLQNERVTVTYLVPSILSFMVNYGKIDAHDLSALRAILFAGEVFPMRYLRRLVELVPQAGYYNLYGPTETNVCTFYQLQPGDTDPSRGDAALPIGMACANTEAFAIDEQGRPVAEPGVEGELWVRGPCVAQGYWGDPEKTARVFVQNPLQALYADRVYRTGDVVVLAPDRRNWIYVGRRDHMVKSRGYRIELGEIESALYKHDSVKEAAAIAVPDELLGNRIYAFVVLAADAGVDVAGLRAFCGQHVPSYMVPERIDICDALPKTSTGKTDRTRLGALAQAGPSTT